MRLQLPTALVNAILAHATATPEREVCGLVAAMNGRPARTYPVTNIAATPASRFQMDPGEQIAAFRAMRERGETLWAIYHSHPNGAASPSPTDLTELAYPQALYLIVALQERNAPQLTAWDVSAMPPQALPWRPVSDG